MNNKEMLKPIGTEYQEEYPPQPSSTNPFPHRITWRVIAHRDCLDEYGRPIQAEQIEAIKVEELSAPIFYKWNNHPTVKPLALDESKKPKLCQACGRINPSKHHSCVSCGANLDNPVIEIDLDGGSD